MKHYIITRFAAWICPNTGMTLETLFSTGFIVSSINKLKTALLPTLENQTIHNFILLILVHDDIPSEKIQELYNINTTFEYHILHISDTANYIKNDAKNDDCVIFSRIDIDDFILNDVVEKIQNIIYNSKEDYIFVGLRDGATYMPQNNTVCRLKPCTYNENGAWSSMITVGCNGKKHIEYIEQYGKIPVMYDHTKMFAEIIKNISDKNTYTIHYIQSCNEPLYLWTYWGDNITIMKRKQTNKELTWHKTNDKLNIDFKKFWI